ncbi:MAG TPA: peroxiredoxin family protein [Gemmataceae bacterium]|nr:peroxiredoxin family protein [Gemmataceae bacterium]
MDLRAVIAVVPAVLFAPLVSQAAGNEAELLAGHSAHGAAFNEGPRQKAHLMGGTGKVHLPVTTKVAQAQAFFNQGVGQLHGFWYFEAERSFRQAAALDPDCAMTYWGMAMANVNNRGRAQGFIQKAVSHKAGASRREQLWIDAYAAYYQDDKRPDKDRRRDLVRRLEDISYEFPNEVEAKAFLAFHVWDNGYRGLPLASNQTLDALIQQVLDVEPMHPVHHYRIHLWDGDKAARALASAARCGQSAPAIAHLWHMPGHIFTALHRYADAAWQQEASARVDHAYMMREGVLPDQIHNYAHNNQWLIENLEYVGRVHDAIDLAKNMIELPRHPRYNSLPGYGSSTEGRRRLLEVLTRYELWDDLIALSRTMYLEPTDALDEQVRRLRALGVAYFSKADKDNGQQQVTALEAMRKTVFAERQAAAEQAEARARQANQPDDKVARAMADAMLPFAGRLRPIDAALAELTGYALLGRGDKGKARAAFDRAGDIPRGRRARIELLLGAADKAERLGREAVDGGQNQVHVLANYVDILQRCGKTTEAQGKFKQLRELSAFVDLDVPVMRRLAAVARALHLPADWRVRATVSSDVGKRPNLKDLGPFRWQPSPAPDWTLADARGKQVSLKDYHGRPVVLIFYLGNGCPHCIQQLNAFGPMVPQFAAAGISLAAVSTETVEGLKKTFKKTRLAADFLLLSDHQLKAFKVYRAFDDFEHMPLHGTFLIDGEGLLRWHDIGYEPFTDARFVLDEARRLLRLPKGHATTPIKTARQ